MKKSILNSILLILALSFVSCGVKHSQKAPSELSNINYGSSRPVAQKNVLKLTANPIPTVRIGFIGVGNRGGSAVRRYTFMKGVEIVALCDLNGSSVTKSQ